MAERPLLLACLRRACAAALSLSLALGSWDLVALRALAAALPRSSGPQRHSRSQVSSSSRVYADWWAFMDSRLLDLRKPRFEESLPISVATWELQRCLSRVLDRTDLAPDSVADLPASEQAQLVKEAVAAYAAKLAAAGTKTPAASQAEALAALRALKDEYQDMADFLELVPEEDQRRLLKRGLQDLEFKVKALEADQQAGVTKAAEDTAEALDQEQGGGPKPQAVVDGQEKAEAGLETGAQPRTVAALALPPVDPPANPTPATKDGKAPALVKPARIPAALSAPKKDAPASPRKSAPSLLGGQKPATKSSAPGTRDQPGGGDAGRSAFALRAAGDLFAKLARTLGWPWGKPKSSPVSPPGASPPTATSIPAKPQPGTFQPETRQVLADLGLDYDAFSRLCLAQAEFEEYFLATNPAAAQAVFSLRTQQRFSKTLLALVRALRKRGEANALSKALAFALVSYYGDILPPRHAVSGLDKVRAENELLLDLRSKALQDFAEFLREEDLVRAWKDPESLVPGLKKPRGLLEARVARALSAGDPAIFKLGPFAGWAFMKALAEQAAALGARLSVLWAHPFTEERQLVGHKVPRKGTDLLDYGLGELARRAREARRDLDAARAQGRPARRHILLIKNVEAMDPGVRTQLQEALRVRELTHPELGRLEIPENLQILFTQEDGENLEDDSFYDRVTVKSLPEPRPLPSLGGAELFLPASVTAANYRDHIGIRYEEERPVLVLPGAEIRLSPEFAGIDAGNMHDMIYLKTGLVLDFATVRMLAAMARAKAAGGIMLRLEGPTGLGKTFAAAAFARLRGSSFHANPVNPDTEFSEWIGGFEQDERGFFRFNGDTPLKQRLEEGGVVAASELNTLLDNNEKASLGWWLAQLAEAEPDADGYRLIRLTEVPVAEGEEVPVIRIHPDALIVIDTNPEGDYGARGKLPDVLKERVPRVVLGVLVTGEDAKKREEIARLALYADMFLKHGWSPPGGASVPGLADADKRRNAAFILAGEYWRAVSARQGREADGRVLSLRELKRLTQDYLMDLAEGASSAKAVEKAVAAHLGAAASPRAFAMAQDQLLRRGRPVHARVPAEADLRAELKGWLGERADLDLTMVNVTDEVDRYVLEGGLVADEAGEGLVDGQGVFGRLIARAKANPDKQVVYVFDNAHNLRPEQIVAANEFLQDGKLRPRRAGGKELELPPNAHILFVSRSDSPLEWSPAERSRFVELSSEQGQSWREEKAAEALAPALAALSPELGKLFTRWVLRVYSRFRQTMLQNAARANLVSNAKFLRLVAAVGQVLEAAAREGLGPAAVASGIKRAADDILLKALPPEEREVLRKGVYESLALYARMLQGALSGGAGSPSPLEILKDEYQAAKDAEKPGILARLKALAAAPGRGLAWVKRSSTKLKPLDMGRAPLPKRVEGIPDEVLFASPDGRFILAAPDERHVELYERKGDGYERVWKEELKGKLVRATMTPDASSLALVFSAGKSPGTLEVRRQRSFPGEERAYWRQNPIELESPCTAIAISPEGGFILAGTMDGHVRGYAPRGVDFDPVPVWTEKLGGMPDVLAVSKGGRLVVAGIPGSVKAFEIESRTEAAWKYKALSLPLGIIYSARASDDRILLGASSRVLLLKRSKGGVFDFDVEAMAPGEDFTSVEFGPDGAIVAGDNNGVSGFKVDGNRLRVLWSVASAGKVSFAAAASNQGPSLVVGPQGAVTFPSQAFLVESPSSVKNLESGEVLDQEAVPQSVEVLADIPEDWAAALAKGREQLARATTQEEAGQAAQELGLAIKGAGQEARWSSKAKEALQDLEVGRALALERATGELGFIRHMAATPDGRVVALADGDLGCQVLVWDGTRYVEIWSGQLDLPARGLALTPDGKTLLVAEGQGDTRVPDAATAGLAVVFAWSGSGEPAPGRGDFKPVWSTRGKWRASEPVGSAAISADGKVIALSGVFGAVAVFRWDGSSLEAPGRRQYQGVFLRAHGLSSLAMAMTPDGRRVLAGPDLVEWDGAAYQDLLETPIPWSEHAALDASGRLAATAMGNQLVVRRVDPATRLLVGVWEDHLPGRIEALSFSPDGGTLLVSVLGGPVRIYRRLGSGPGYALIKTIPIPETAGVQNPALWLSGLGGALIGERAGTLRRVEPLVFAVADEKTGYALETGQPFQLDTLDGSVETLEPPNIPKPRPDSLTEAKLAFDGARSPEEKKKALERLKAAVAQSPAAWSEVAAKDLRPLDVARAMAPTAEVRFGESVNDLAMSPDASLILVSIGHGGWEGRYRLTALAWDGTAYQKVWTQTLAADEFVQSLSVSADGGKFLIGLRRAALRGTLSPATHDQPPPEARSWLDLLEWDGTMDPSGNRKMREVWSIEREGGASLRGELSADGRFILAVDGSQARFLEWDGEPANKRGRKRYVEVKSESLPVTTLSLSADGSAFALVAFDLVRVYRKGEDGQWRMWEKRFEGEEVMHVSLDSTGASFVVATKRDIHTKTVIGEGFLKERASPKPMGAMRSGSGSRGPRPGPSIPAPINPPSLVPAVPSLPPSLPSPKPMEVDEAGTQSGTQPDSSVKIRSFRLEGESYRSDWGEETTEHIHALELSGDGKTLVVKRGAEILGYKSASPGGVFSKVWDRPADNSLALGLSPDGKTVVMAEWVSGAWPLTRLDEQPLIVSDAETLVAVNTGAQVKAETLPERVEGLDAGVKSLADAGPAFAPRYGDKPFYFAADAAGKVYLNYKGRWYPTRHRLAAPQQISEAAFLRDSARSAAPEARIQGLGPETARLGGRRLALKVVALSELLDPYAEDGRTLSEADFLMETSALEEVEDSALWAFAEGWAVNLIGRPGGGKTSIARELALLLGLPRQVFQMHGERELSDALGSYREDKQGRIHLTAKPYIDEKGRKRFRQPLLDFLVNGGVFDLDEGAVGDRAREFLSWFAAAAAGDKEIVLHEFPGHEERLAVHPDFHLVVTNNLVEETAGRQSVKSELGSRLHTVYVEEDESPDTLTRLFLRFLGLVPVPAEEGRAWGRAAALLHHALKPLVGKALGKDGKDRYYLSKREIRRLAAQVRRQLAQNPKEEPGYALYRAMRIVYESMFTHAAEREIVLAEIDRVLALLERLKDPAFDPRAAAVGTRAPAEESPEREIRRAAERHGVELPATLRERFAATVNKALSGIGAILGVPAPAPKAKPAPTWKERFEEEMRALAPDAVTENEARASGIARRLMEQGEAVLFLAENGARAQDALLAAIRLLGAKLDTVDAAPEHGELELLGGLLPVYGPRPPGTPRSRDARGALTRHLLTKEELERYQKSGEARPPLVLWIRNVDQWKEELRTAINGLLEDGYVDLEVDGRVQRFYKPPYLAFAAEMPADSTSEFSSAFFNRWVKIGVSADSTERPGAAGGIGGGPSELELVLRSLHGLEEPAARALAALARLLFEWDKEGGWRQRKNHELGPSLIFAVAEAMRWARREDPALSWEEALAQEARRLIASRFSAEKAGTDLPDAERFERLLGIVLAGELPAREPALLTEDQTLDSPMASIGGVRLRRGPGALTLRQALRKNGIKLNKPMLEALVFLARADSLGKAAALVGETGAGKTTVAGLFADLTGREFYKYQSHAASELADLTIDIEQAETGEFKKRVKELYRRLQEGNVVIDLDEANVAPWVLWVLEPLLRGERRVQPIFPEEPPFDVGDGVSVVLTFNPERYSGRNRIDRRLMERMAVAWMALPSAADKARIIETFYGIWEDAAPALAPVPPAGSQKQAKPRKPAALKAKGLKAREKGDRLMREGEETFDPEKPVKPAKKRSGPKEEVHGIFTPELYPYNRLGAFDEFDEEAGEFARDPKTLDPVPVKPLLPAALEAAEKALSRDHDFFWGRVALELGPDWQILPSAGADAKVLGLEAYGADGQKLDLDIELGRDSADNLYIRAKAKAAAELRYRLAVPAAYFGKPVPKGIPLPRPQAVAPEVAEALRLMGVTGREADFRELLYKIVGFFRDFSLKADGIAHARGASLYQDLVRSKCGVCRHRAFAFARTLLALGVPARYVVSEIHAWAEVEVPGLGWLRVDLGGGGDPRNMDLSAVSGRRHSSRYNDDLPEPDTYRKNREMMAKRQAEALEEQGLAGGGGQPGGDGGGGGGRGGGGLGPVDEARITAEAEAFRARIKEDVKLNDELSALFEAGQGDTQFIFSRMLRAMQDRIRVVKRLVKRGLEIDPVAFMLRKPKQFAVRERRVRMQTTAASFLFDFSYSQHGIRDALAFAVAAVGVNGADLRELAPQRFYFDLSWMADAPVSVVGFTDRLSREELGPKLVAMANRIGQGGTAILAALKKKREEMMEVREVRSAKSKYLVFFTDGEDYAVSRRLADGGWELTREAAGELEKYRQAGIELYVVGYGDSAQGVAAFRAPGVHHVLIPKDRPYDIAEAIAKIAEAQSRGAGGIPPGDIGPLLQIGP